MPHSDPDTRRTYRKLWQREYRKRNRKPVPRQTVATATANHAISLKTAGLEAGRQYLATPRLEGAILLTPVPEDDE